MSAAEAGRPAGKTGPIARAVIRATNFDLKRNEQGNPLPDFAAVGDLWYMLEDFFSGHTDAILNDHHAMRGVFTLGDLFRTAADVERFGA